MERSTRNCKKNCSTWLDDILKSYRFIIISIAGLIKWSCPHHKKYTHIYFFNFRLKKVLRELEPEDNYESMGAQEGDMEMSDYSLQVQLNPA